MTTIHTVNFKRFIRLTAAVIIISLAASGLILLYIFKIYTPDTSGYPVRGVDVSSYQGEIDWEELSQGLDFAFIKATEGSSYCDEYFAVNYAGARKTHLRVGAYHFFSFDSGGDTQAQNFIDNVEPYENMLPPVIDVEFYGSYCDEPKAAEEVIPQLKLLLDSLEEYYGLKPIIYAAGSAYSLYIRDSFSEYDLWLRSVYSVPDDGWTFWQYSDKGKLDGYYGEEKHIDLDVFYGSKEQFKNYGCAE